MPLKRKTLEESIVPDAKRAKINEEELVTAVPRKAKTLRSFKISLYYDPDAINMKALAADKTFEAFDSDSDAIKVAVESCRKLQTTGEFWRLQIERAYWMGVGRLHPDGYLIKKYEIDDEKIVFHFEWDPAIYTDTDEASLLEGVDMRTREWLGETALEYGCKIVPKKEPHQLLPYIGIVD